MEVQLVMNQNGGTASVFFGLHLHVSRFNQQYYNRDLPIKIERKIGDQYYERT